MKTAASPFVVRGATHQIGALDACKILRQEALPDVATVSNNVL
jgi:hypothetical protein